MANIRFEQLIDRHQRAVYTYARSLTGSHPAAEDATQETFLRAWKYLDSYRGDGSAEGWLIRICRNWVFDSNHRSTHRVAVEERAHRFRSSRHEPDLRAEIYDALAHLPIEQREVLALCGILGHDYEATAAMLAIPVGTVRSRLFRGRRALRANLAGEEIA